VEQKASEAAAAAARADEMMKRAQSFEDRLGEGRKDQLAMAGQRDRATMLLR
jgi:hypothetical protein